MQIQSKLPDVGTTIFTVMSRLANEHRAINLSQGFPNFDCSPRLIQLVNEYMNKGMNQYAPMAGAMPLREQLAQKIYTLYQNSIHPETEITITAGATQAIYCVIAAFIRQNDEVIIVDPAYDSYAPSVVLNGGKPVAYELKSPNYNINWTELEQLVSPKTKMIVVNTPHNPTGSILSAKDMRTLQDLVEKYDLLVLSDEVYEHLIYDDVLHESALKYPQLFQRTLATYSFGKTFHSTGWKMGYCVASEHLMKEFRKVHQFNVFSVNTPVQYAMAEFLKNPDEYLSLPYFYQQKRDFFEQAMSTSRFEPLSCSGTYFQLYDYSAISDESDIDFTKRLTTEYGVAAIPISVFYTSKRDEKVIRLCFAKTEETLEKAAELLVKV